MAFGQRPLIAGFFYGIKPAVAAIFFAAWRIGSRVLRHRLLWAIAAASFLAIFALKLPFPAIVVAGGHVADRLVPQAFAIAGRAPMGGMPLLSDDGPL